MIMGLIGPNGAGKTTLFNVLTGIYQPDEGEFRFEGAALHGMTPDRIAKLGIARTFQNIRLFANLSALENVMLPMDIAGVPRKEQAERAAALLDQVGIDANRHQHRPGKLSGGQQQRVAIARALANDPAVILAESATLRSFVAAVIGPELMAEIA